MHHSLCQRLMCRDPRTSKASQEGSSYTYTLSRLLLGPAAPFTGAHALLRLQSLPNQPAWHLQKPYLQVPRSAAVQQVQRGGYCHIGRWAPIRGELKGMPLQGSSRSTRWLVCGSSSGSIALQPSSATDCYLVMAPA
jgi:hypothetical protein